MKRKNWIFFISLLVLAVTLTAYTKISGDDDQVIDFDEGFNYFYEGNNPAWVEDADDNEYPLYARTTGVTRLEVRPDALGTYPNLDWLLMLKGNQIPGDPSNTYLELVMDKDWCEDEEGIMTKLSYLHRDPDNDCTIKLQYSSSTGWTDIAELTPNWTPTSTDLEETGWYFIDKDDLDGRNDYRLRVWFDDGDDTGSATPWMYLDDWKISKAAVIPD